jgi:pyruvate/2-oxoglutarate dehydrogenase complex dihydrolipoamide dehydrogenase (E3) component
MNDPESYDAVIIGGGKGGKTLAMYLGRQKYKTALIERDPMIPAPGVIGTCLLPFSQILN